MANPSQALIAFGRLVSFFDTGGGSGDSAEVQFEWFADPLNLSLLAMPQNRARLHEFFQALIHDNATGLEPTFPIGGLVWEPVKLGADIGVGFAWHPTEGPLRLGLGAAASFSAGDQLIDLAVLARLIRIESGNLIAEVPGVLLGGSIPVPDFLQSASLTGELPSPTTVSLTVDEDATNSRTIAVPGPQLAWDSARLVVFILQAWVHEEATGGDSFIDRINEHLFPMFGDPPGGPISAFPIFGEANMGQPADFDPWVDSVVTLDGDGAGALTFLWHLRALLTGNEDSSFLDGSMFFPLDVNPSSGGVPTLADAAGTLTAEIPGAFVGVEDGLAGEDARLVLRVQSGQDTFSIPLAANSGGSLTRPNLTDDPATLSGYPLPDWMSVSGLAPTRVTLLSETLPVSAGYGGPCKVDLLLTQGQPVGYEVILPTTPALTLTFPQGGGGPFPGAVTPEQAFNDVFALLAAAAGGQQAEDVVNAIQAMIGAGLTGGDPDVQPLLSAILGAAGGEGSQSLKIGDLLTIDLEAGAGLKISLDLDDVDDALEGSAVRIGKLGFDATLALAPPVTEPVTSIKMRLDDMRIDPEAAGAGGVAGSLLGDLTEAPGFSFSVEWEPPNKVTPAGGGRIPIGQSIGPLELSSLEVDVDKDGLSMAVDAALAMGPVTVTPYELGVRVPFTDGAPEPFLHGLGLSMDANGIKLAGHFGEVNGDYVGAAVVSVVDFFELSAIGGYTKLPDDSASLFIFASLVAPLGGPPFMFVTGVAGGFGYNRQLPPPGPISENPFMRVMRGEIDLGGSNTSALQTLSQQFLPAKNQHWIAAGMQFLSFGFIQGKLVVVIGFPNFSLRILGSAAFGISPVAYFEIELEASADDEQFRLIAGLSHNSYVIHPDIFSLHGQFGLATWHGGEHAGDFVFSIGGYHNAFPVPAHYPSLERVGVTATVYGFIKMSVTCYFATTPQAMMAGAAVSLSAEFAGIAAGLDIYIDVYIQWDPFFIQGRLGVVVWFEFMGRHEIGVRLEIHTPPLGGVATIDLLLVSFDIEFGTSLDKTPRLQIHEFLDSQLGVEATPWNGDGAQVAALSTADRAGLFRLDMLWGRTAGAGDNDDPQEGMSANKPIRVGSEFAFAVRTRLPVEGVPDLPNPQPVGSVSFSSFVDLPLCRDGEDLDSRLTVEGNKIGAAQRRLLDDSFPAAQFGPETPSYQPDSSAKAQIGAVDTDGAVVDLTEGLDFTYHPRFDPVEAAEWDIVATEEPSLGADERYPLPLDPPSQPLVARIPKARMSLASSGGHVFVAPASSIGPKLTRAALARQRIETRIARPMTLEIHSAAIQQRVGLGPIAGSQMLSGSGMEAAAPPASPVRRPEMQTVSLRRVQPKLSNVSRGEPPVVPGLIRPDVVRELRTGLAKREGGGRNDSDRLSVAPGHAVHVQIQSDRPVQGSLKVSDGQYVRAVFLGARGLVVDDVYVAGGQTTPIPARTRQVVFIGEGARVPVSPGKGLRGSRQPILRATEAVGVEHDSILTALSPRTFAAHGCLVEALSAHDEPVDPLDSLTGYDLLRVVPNLRIHFPAVPSDGTLVLFCEPIGSAAPSSADQIRWRTVDAELGALETVARPDRVALAMPVVADEPWAVELDVGAQWRIAGVVWRPQSQGETVRWLTSSASWDMTDDRRSAPARPVSTSIDMDFEP